MKLVSRIALLLLLIAPCFAQSNYSAVSSTALKNSNGDIIASGTITFAPDRQFGFATSSAACCLKDVPLTATVTAGAFTLNVPEATHIKRAALTAF